MPVQPTSPPAAEWNALGRRHIARLNTLIANSREGRDTPKDWPHDPRTLDQAQGVLAAVEAEDRAGRWRTDSPVADRAHEPFVDMLNDVCQSPSCVCILGADELLVRLGTYYKPGPALHLHGGQAIERPDILAAAITRDHDLLLLVRQKGFSISRRLDDEPIAHFPWPQGVTPGAVDIVEISEDGRTIAFVEQDNAVWLGQAEGSSIVWSCVYPSAAFLARREAADEDDDERRWSDSMMHCGLSPDGQFIAYGSQCHGHFIDHIDSVGIVRRWAEIGGRSEYPHYACFSGDSAFAALNACHLYHGATVGVRLADVEGAETPACEEDERTTLIDDRLRVYAATWLPLGSGKDGFALAGAGYLHAVSTKGEIRNITHFGSSASSIDYCPKTNVLAVASYSGFLHLYDRPNRQRSTRASAIDQSMSDTAGSCGATVLRSGGECRRDELLGAGYETETAPAAASPEPAEGALVPSECAPAPPSSGKMRRRSPGSTIVATSFARGPPTPSRFAPRAATIGSAAERCQSSRSSGSSEKNLNLNLCHALRAGSVRYSTTSPFSLVRQMRRG
jgi:hypothetical protein